MLFHNPRHLVFLVRPLLQRSKLLPFLRVRTQRFFSHSAQSWLSMPGNSIIDWPSLPIQERNPDPNPKSNAGSNFSRDDFSTIATLFADPSISPGPALDNALDRAGIEPDPTLLQAVINHFDSSPKLLHTLFLWAQKRPEFQPSVTLFNSMINVLAKSREFDSAWILLLERIDSHEEAIFVSGDTFAIMIRRYALAGMSQSAIRTFEYARNLKPILDSNSEMRLFEILLDSLCKEGSVRAASEYFLRRKKMDPLWVPSVRIYNIMLNGWFRSRKLKHAERFWAEMKKENVRPSVVTYGTLVEGYCRMRRLEKAIELVSSMTKQGIEPNAIVYNPIIDALAEAGRFREALGMLERFLVLETGPTSSTYNSLVKGFCKAGDLVGASKILKMMISRDFMPSPTTYNYFFRYFSRCGKVDEGMNLYTKMIESGYTPDRLTYHLLLKMLCEEGKLNLAVQVSKEMRHKGYDMDLATCTMLVHLLCKMHRLEEAFAEFENMIRRGIVPQYLTFQRMNNALKKRGMIEMARKLCSLMSSVPHSTNLPNSYVEDIDEAHARRQSIMQKAKAFSDMLKNIKDPRELAQCGSSSENAVCSAECLMDNIKKRIKKP
ncbi:pentatricopeptide repeat-containing protein At5g11310, mitochondrial [Prosopis cineraria]|uniref:pentatricopeptide repeat-containing protein At5g11310, mitochondrial n=1 Tax=Prosopis cineraria TaxID=364024 RepID=UPI002410084D|nr:pentatricopeptide repeat-containing protein At5g11310, mitochondrial [Prosopis cineraria]XP_054797176.1 pentatricopeptide repeat-containing protein At5g11310, mitochondrial [Prosopis cineraria]XP_054797177.1 pentatricopeptide repeat-containing protein At5g11310, mitochondrial [Prosopis cineraria]